ncbi:MAG: S1C family serine protease [Patescibacteria group bacterium]|jgi:S1-C subfamily serine protease|nr:S1C family serine protease [Patescibacteria group bacterium]
MVKKIDITDDLEEKEVEIKKSERLNALENRQNKAEKKISEFYQNKEFSFEKPKASTKGLVWLIIIWSIVFGLAGGTLASYFMLTRESINIPFLNKEIKLNKIFSPKEVSTVTEKNVTVLAETRMAELVDDLFVKTVRIFKTKTQDQTSFLEQIYAPWQALGIGAFVSPNGWLITAYNFEPETDYVVVDYKNNILSIEKIISDPITDLSFYKINQEESPFFELEEKKGIIPGQQAIISDKLQNVHLTAISQPLTRNIFKTEDLVYSSDKFSEFMRLEFSEVAFPQSLIFGLNGKLLGFISQKAVPAWQVRALIDQVVATGEIKRPFLGIDYLRIDQAPGLTSPRFKDLNQGLIVYGSPLANSPAEKAGIKNADVIVKIDGQIIDKNIDLTELVLQKIPQEMEITVLREGEQIILKVVLE